MLRSEEHVWTPVTRPDLVCRLLLEKKKTKKKKQKKKKKNKTKKKQSEDTHNKHLSQHNN